MWRDALRILARTARDLLFGAAFFLGMTLTPAAAWVGLSVGRRMISGHSCGLGKNVSTAKARVKAARDAATQYMIETPSCPRDIADLVAGRFLDRSNAKDPWGSELTLRCPGMNDSDGADVTSLGPDKRLGTADDINSWDP
jgi:hypothetical protein